MSLQVTLDRLRELCDRVQPGWQQVVHVDEVRRIIADADPQPEGLVITNAEAGILLAMIDGRPVDPEARTELIEAITGRLQTIRA